MTAAPADPVYLFAVATGLGAAALAVVVAPFGAMWVPEARTPAARIATVARFSLRGVIQRGLRVASQARIPVVAAPAVIAVAMHCMHMARE